MAETYLDPEMDTVDDKIQEALDDSIELEEGQDGFDIPVEFASDEGKPGNQDAAEADSQEAQPQDVVENTDNIRQEQSEETLDENVLDESVKEDLEETPEDTIEQSPEDDEAEAEDAEDPVDASEEAEAEVEEAEGDSKEDPDDPKEDAKEDAKEDTKEKKGFFDRLKKDKEKEKLKTQIDDLTDRLKRNMAEFDNYRKRTEKEKSSMYIIGAKDIVEKMLPVLDNFERGFEKAPEGDAFADGMRMIYRQMLTALEEAGVKPIEAMGQPFDPNLHNAVMHEDNPEVGENIITQEFQKGYTYKDFVVRHSMVKVAN